MLSTKYRLKMSAICKKIANNEKVDLEEMIWAEKLAKSHTTAKTWLQQARRQSSQNIKEGSTDDFMNRMGLGDPDPSKHKNNFEDADDINDWFRPDRSDDWRQRD